MWTLPRATDGKENWYVPGSPTMAVGLEDLSSHLLFVFRL